MLTQIQHQSVYARWCLVLSIVLCVALSWWQIVDIFSKDLLDDLLKQAASVYGVARIINGTLTLLQSVQLSIPVVGGASIAPLEIFAPWNDLIDRFSTLMELSIGSLFIQRLLIEIVATQWYQIMLTVAGVGACVSIVRPQWPFAAVWIKGFILVGVARYAMLVVVLLNGAVDQAFLHHRTTTDLQQMTQLTTVMEDNVDTENADERKVLQQRLLALESQRDVVKEQYHAALDDDQKKRLTSTLHNLNTEIARVQAESSMHPMQLMKSIATSGRQVWATISQQLDDSIETVLRLMATFILQTMLLPLLFLWGIKRVLQWMLQRTPSEKN